MKDGVAVDEEESTVAECNLFRCPFVLGLLTLRSGEFHVDSIRVDYTRFQVCRHCAPFFLQVAAAIQRPPRPLS